MPGAFLGSAADRQTQPNCVRALSRVALARELARHPTGVGSCGARPACAVGRSNPVNPLLLLRAQQETPLRWDTQSASVAAVSTPAPYPGRENEDGLALIDLAARGVVVALADGAGGHASGQRAADLALRAVVSAMEEAEDVQSAIMGAFDRANQAVLELSIGAATTLVVVHVADGRLRTYHAGDSGVIVVGQRGKLKLQTIAHSPVGYAIEAGVLKEEDAMGHSQRHIVSNLIGSHHMHIDVGSSRPLSPFDTVVIASDGLFDNLSVEEVSQVMRKGSLATASEKLVAAARERMQSTDKPAKPDDLSFVALRTTAPPKL